MTIYKIRFDRENFMSFDLDLHDAASKMGRDFIYGTSGGPEAKPLKNRWIVSNGRFVDDSDYLHSTNLPDIAEWYSSCLVLNKRAYDVLMTKIEPYGEFLPVNVEGGNTWYMFNISKMNLDMDYVDLKNSEQILVEGVYAGINKLRFIDGKVKDLLVFRTVF